MAVHSRSFAALDPFEKSLELFSNLNTINFWKNFCWIEFLEIEYKKNFFLTSKNIQIRIYNLIINYSNIQILSPVYFPYRKKKVKKSTFSNVTFRICKTSLLPNWREGGFLLIDDSQTPHPPFKNENLEFLQIRVLHLRKCREKSFPTVVTEYSLYIVSQV